MQGLPVASDSELESEFLLEFRAAAVRWASSAALAGGLLFLVFAGVAAAGEAHTPLMQLVRLGLASLLVVVAFCARFRIGLNAGNYVAVAALVASVALAGAVVLPLLPGDQARHVAEQAAPALMFALFLHYAFLRLPLALAAGIGWGLCVAALVLFRDVLEAPEVVRLGVYLAFANLFGMVLLHLIESRERSLFLQTRAAMIAREESRHRQRTAEEADRQKARLIAAVNHDLRQPMTAALAYMNVMLSRLPRDGSAGALVAAERLQAALGMLGSTLDQVLTYARCSGASDAIELSRTELRPLLQSLYETHVPEADRRAVGLQIRLPKKIPLLITDPRAIHRVLGNLISNAIKFNDPERGRGRVLVAARIRGDRCRIDVFDNGIGISPESVDEIWKPYVQLNNAERDRERGLGLGLFLVRTIVEQLPGHTIEMASTPGRGSRFTITLPTGPMELPVERPAPQVLPSETLDLAPLAGRRAVVLEDDRDTRLAIVDLLNEWGVGTITAASVSELHGRRAERVGRVDAIVCDYRLAGGTNGFDAIDGLRRRLGYAPPAVLITGEPDVEPLRERAGPDTVVLHKPFAPEVLARSLLEAALREDRKASMG